ncbi:putative repeat protein (TIGR01451 family), partial [Mongoliibacter ruber]
MRDFLPTLKIFVLLLAFVFSYNEKSFAQSKILANEITFEQSFSSGGTVPENALNDTPGSFARSVSNPGLLIGVGAVTGVLELQFPETRPAGSVSYIQIDGDENLFNALIGGSLGDALADVLGAIILGNQVITIEARNNTTTVLSRNSNQGFSTDAARLVQDKDGNFYLAVRPDQSYNRLRITNAATSLVGLFTGYTLDVYNAFFLDEEDTCGSPLFTSFDGSGVNLDLLDIGNSGVNDLGNAIDGDFETFSTISPGVLSLGGSLSQFFDFGSLSRENDEVQVTLSGTPSLLDLDLLGNIRFRAYNGTNVIFDQNLSALNTEILGLIQLDLLGLLADGNTVTIPIQPGASFDRFEIEVTAVLSVGLNESLRVHEVVQTPGRPNYENPEDASLLVCATDEVTLNVLSQSGETVNWYAQPIGGTVLESGNTFEIGNVSQRSVYYAGISREGCPIESARVPVTVDVDNNPKIGINGAQVFNLAIGESIQLPESVAFNEDGTEVGTDITALNGAPLQGEGMAGPFNSAGVFVYRVSAVGDNCTNFLDIVVNVQDFEDCPLVYSPEFANDGTEFTTSSLLGIQLGSVTNPENAVDGDLSTFSLLQETVGTTLLGLTGETAQFLKWNIQQAAGNTVTVKLGREYAGIAQAAAGIYIQAFDNGEAVGNRTFADVNLVSVLNGINEFNFTFVPTDFSGQPVSFDAVKVSLVPILNVDQRVRVYGAYTNIATVDAPVCEPFVRELQTGFVSLIGALDVASALTGVFNPERAVDGDLETFASINNAVGVNNYSKLEVAYNYPILVGDSLKITIGIPTGLLDLSLLEGLIIQRFIGNEAIGAPIDVNSSLLNLRLLTENSTGELSFVSDVPFDRIQILYGGLASVLEEVRIFEIEAIPNVSIEGEFFDEEDGVWKLEICEGDPIDFDEEECGEVRLFSEAEGGDEIDPSSISELERGEILNVYIQVNRFGCELDSQRRLLEISITGSAPPTGEAEQIFCETDSPTIADLIAEGEEIQWYDVEQGGTPLETDTPLVDGETYFASQTEEGECESIERFAVLVVISSTPAPTASALLQEFCFSDNASLAQIAIEGENIQWYSSETDQTPLPLNTLLEDGVTYFATQTDADSGCESLERLGITINLIDCEPDFAKLEITKVPGSATVVAGTELTYTITVANTGTAAATEVTVADALPEFTEFVSADNGGTLEGGTVNWNLGTLDAGENITLNLVLSVPSDVEAGTMIRNIAVVDSPDDPDGPIDNDPDPDDDVE